MSGNIMSNAYVRIGVVIVAIIAAAAAVVPATNMQIALGQGQQTPFDALAMRVNLTPDPVR
jgi:hypothetical protein